ncbi:hypothetical protein [Halalkalicoccus sp. NIPERK01]|uniref:DUF7509 family protein n=1 Tax=Halalkalicoccus sp. NIPERK01 TaxID=3053469 RepID=UPI00256EAD82|nr:hypothetical protein [Halalkalicoccus sp. NIPERK01]MDL5363155.1 hypothetical protein [Halalkalicoccus sp. NIPERK01]
MRDRLIGELGELAHSRFLVYLMGPYKTFDVDALLDAAENDDRETLSSIPETVNFGTLVGSDIDLDRQEAVLDLLLYARDRLRTDPGVNAFLAIDIDIPLEEMDAATQSIEFALASNAVVYIVPRIGDNLGVGIETGSVLEAIFRQRDERTPTTAHQERVLFIHESGVRSAMIAAVQDRWDARVYSYDDRDDLVHQLRLFVRDLARREQRGDLPQLD